MWRIAAIAVVAVLLAGCGGERAATSAPTPGGPCPEGTEFVSARDVIGPSPAGYDVLPPVRGALDAFVAQLRERLGERWRGHDAKVLARPGAEYGTAVLVVNTHERIDDTMEGALAAERDAGTQGEPIEIAGESGRLNVSADGAYLGIAAAGDCAMVMLVADQERLLRGAASVMGSRR